MIGLLTDNPSCLLKSSLIDTSNLLITDTNEIYEYKGYDYPFKFAFTDGNKYHAAGMAARLIDNGCSVIIYLGDCEHIIEDKVFNIVRLADFPNTRLIRFIDRENHVEAATLSPVKDLNPYSPVAESIVTECAYSNVQDLILLSSSNDLGLLGKSLLLKFDLILETDYEEYDEVRDFDDFSPVDMLDRVYKLIGVPHLGVMACASEANDESS